MLTIDEIRKRLADMNLAKVSKNSGVEYQKILYLCRNEQSEPAHSTIEALSDYLEKKGN